jgi:formylglycine-generating enzyme required for sulfatase activity
MKNVICLAAVCMMAAVNFASADIIRGINIDFVTIGNAGNPGDTRDGGLANPYGCGAVSYEYRIGKYEITNGQWNQFVAYAGAPTGSNGSYSRPPTFTGINVPTNNVSWYEAIQFCNYLTSGDKSKGVYQFSGNNANPGSFLGIDRVAAQKAPYSNGTVYVIPTEDEWYKAAYYTGRDYSTYANGTDIIPIEDVDSNYDGEYGSHPWDVGTGTEEQNGTFDMMGNVGEWTETKHDQNTERIHRGHCYALEGYYMASSVRDTLDPLGDSKTIGFRVATIPEPTSLLLLGLGGLVIRSKLRR